MATSRTGTATWKALRKRAIYRAKRAGLTHCPLCNIELNYEQSRLPNSPEPDHIIPHSRGGPDHIDNLVIICRLCNQSKGNRDAPATPKRTPHPIKTSRQW